MTAPPGPGPSAALAAGDGPRPTAGALPAPGGPGPLVPALYEVVGSRRQAADVVTLCLEPHQAPATGHRGAGRPAPVFEAGQFNMLTAFGVGEVAISISSQPGGAGPLEHTVRDVGAVTHALCRAESGTVVGVRGPFGTGWGIDRLRAGAQVIDVVVVAGGIGVAPLRGALSQLAAGGGAVGRVVLLLGGRSPDQVLFGDDLRRWQQAGVAVRVIVDMADRTWTGPVGTVTNLVAAEELDPGRTVALVCGPEVMIRFTARALMAKGVDPGRILVSLERNMQCGVGLCGHCQLGPLLLCRDGPVVAYGGAAAELLSEHER